MGGQTEKKHNLKQSWSYCSLRLFLLFAWFLRIDIDLDEAEAVAEVAIILISDSELIPLQVAYTLRLM